MEEKNIYYFCVAIIIILAGICIYDLQNTSDNANTKDYIYKKYFPYLAVLLVCIMNTINIAKGTGDSLMMYGKLTDEEKKLYDMSKVRISQILFGLSLIILTVLAFVSLEIYSSIITPPLFIVLCLIEIVVLFIFSKTKLVINWFCKKKLN